MSTPAPERSAGLDLDVLEPVTEAIESGAGLFEVVRAAARALDASLALLDRGGAALAMTPPPPPAAAPALLCRGPRRAGGGRPRARAPPPASADERALLSDGPGVTAVDLRVADAVVGELRVRPRSESSPAMLKLVATLIASEVERVRGPERASEEATASFLASLLARGGERASLVARGKELDIDVEAGGSVVMARAHPGAPAGEGRGRRGGGR